MEYQSSNGLTSIMHLPDDCLSFIYQWLNTGYDRESFGLTCRRWLNIQNINRHSLQFQCSLSIVSISYLSESSLNVNTFHLHRLLSRFQHLQSLSLSGCTELPDSALIHLQHFGSKLRTLYLDCCFEITDVGASLIASSCPALVVISLYRCNITDEGLESLANSCSALRNVNLSYCSLISDNGLKALSRCCRQLRAVKVSCCRKIGGTGFAGCSPTLSFIDADSCKLEPKGISGIVSGCGVECLVVSSVTWRIHEDDFQTIKDGFAKRLRILNMRLCRSIGDVFIRTIAEGCPLLHEWNLAFCHEVRISGWESIGLNCHSLKKLHVNRCRNLCDHGLQALRNGCRGLDVLYLSHCCRVTPIAIELFKLYRGEVEIKQEIVTYTGPDWTIW